MHLFYTPGIVPPQHTLSEEESRHALRVLRLGHGDRVLLTDGRGTMYTAEITVAGPKECTVTVIETMPGYCKRGYLLAMAVAPTKNSDRFEWFLEKATEVGCDVFIPLLTSHAERRVFRSDRSVKVITSAVKQSLKAWHPALEELTSFKEVVSRPFDGVKLIAYCGGGYERKLLKDCVVSGDNVLILIGPEGDFSDGEVALAVSNGFTPLSLGNSRLRTETAALAAVMGVAFINQ